MKKFQKRRFENPIENLLDCFRFISREIESDSLEQVSDHRYLLTKQDFAVTVRRDQTEDQVIEELTIHMKWDTDCFEKMIYKTQSTQQAEWVSQEKAHLINLLETNPDRMAEINQLQIEMGRQTFPDAESYARSVHFILHPDCSLLYETNKIARGLQTFANLRMPDPCMLGEENLKQIYECMIVDVSDEIKRLTGKNWADKSVEPMLRAGKLDKPHEFKHFIADASPPWVIGYPLGDLCKYYVGNLPQGLYASE